MTHKLRQQLYRAKLTPSNRLPNARSAKFLVNYMRVVRANTPSPELRAALGLISWKVARKAQTENRIMYRASCPLTGRSRGTSRRFSVARTRVKFLAGQGKLFGLRKSSW